MKVEKEFWIARDCDKSLYIYGEYPEKSSFMYKIYSGNFLRIDSHLFPEVTWDNGPRKIKLTLELDE